MNISEIKAAIAKGLIVACGDSRHIVVPEVTALWGYEVLNKATKRSVGLSRGDMDNCFIVDGE
jgi:hypothetical protein